MERDLVIVRQALPEPTPPALRAALLMCGKCRRPTMHQFVVNRRAGEVGAYEQIYACTTCHTERRYGLLG